MDEGNITMDEGNITMDEGNITMDKKECENILKEMGFSTSRSQSNAAGLLAALGRHGLEKPKKKKRKKVLETIDVMEPKKIYRKIIEEK